MWCRSEVQHTLIPFLRFKTFYLPRKLESGESTSESVWPCEAASTDAASSYITAAPALHPNKNEDCQWCFFSSLKRVEVNLWWTLVDGRHPIQHVTIHLQRRVTNRRTLETISLLPSRGALWPLAHRGRTDAPMADVEALFHSHVYHDIFTCLNTVYELTVTFKEKRSCCVSVVLSAFLKQGWYSLSCSEAEQPSHLLLLNAWTSVWLTTVWWIVETLM